MVLVDVMFTPLPNKCFTLDRTSIVTFLLQCTCSNGPGPHLAHDLHENGVFRNYFHIAHTCHFGQNSDPPCRYVINQNPLDALLITHETLLYARLYSSQLISHKIGDFDFQHTHTYRVEPVTAWTCNVGYLQNKTPLFAHTLHDCSMWPLGNGSIIHSLFSSNNDEVLRIRKAGQSSSWQDDIAFLYHEMEPQPLVKHVKITPPLKLQCFCTMNTSPHPPHDIKDHDYLCIPNVAQDQAPLDGFIAIVGQQLHIMKVSETRRLLVDLTDCPVTQTWWWHEVQIQAQLTLAYEMTGIPQEEPGYIRENWPLKVLEQFSWNPRLLNWEANT